MLIIWLTGEERLYIGGDAYSAPAVDVCDADGQWELHYIGRDYLGSITHIADSEGNLVAEYSYDAWGRLRDPATQELYGNSGVSDLLLWRGFTGHEWLPWFGLYNMNARLYDPVLGRFLSPDPYVQMPDNTQNLNRYLYALNNPFQYKDDSGEFILSMIVGALIGAGVSALTYSVGTLVSGADWDWKNFGKTIGIGAFSGALGGALSFFKETFSNMYIYNMTSKIATKTITDAIFSDFDLKSLHGTITSTLVSAVISTSNESALIQSLNNISEEGYHLLTGTVSSFASGMANSYAYGNTDLIWQSIANGAISSVSNSIVNGLLSSTNQKAEKIELTKLGALSKKKQEWIKRRQDEANNEENTDLGYSANKQNLFSKNIHLPQLPFEYSSSFQMGEASYYNHNLYPIFIY